MSQNIFPLQLFLFWSIKSLWHARGAFLKKWQLRWPLRRNITFLHPCAAAILASTSLGFLPVRTSRWKKLFFGDFIMKNHKLYVNFTILTGLFAITRSKIVALTLRNEETTQLDEPYIYADKNFLLNGIFRKLYSKNWKHAKNSRLCQLWAQISWPTDFSQPCGLWQ